MAYLKVSVLALLAASTFASPIGESYSTVVSHPSVSYSHAPIVKYAQAPIVSYSPAPILSYSHAPIAVHQAPVKVEVENYAPAQYEFKYGVNDPHTHDIKEQAEKRVGDKVEGYYKLVEADGTTRTVHYTSDKHTGFNAVVTKSGHASHPATPIKVAVPVQKVVAAPILSYAHAAPVLSYAAPAASYAPAPSYSHGSPSVSFSSSVLHH